MNGANLSAWQTARPPLVPRKQNRDFRLPEDERRAITLGAGITPTGQKRSASNQPGIFFFTRAIPRVSAKTTGIRVPSLPHKSPGFKSRSLSRVTISLQSRNPFDDNRQGSSSFKFDVNFDVRSRRYSPL